MQEALIPELERICGNPECNETLVGRGKTVRYCSVACRTKAMHHRKREASIGLTHKVCPVCKVDKPIDQFAQPWRYECRSCDSVKSKRRYHRAGGKEYARKKILAHRYNLTPEEYDARLEAQGGRCAICGVKPKGRLHVDHDHATGAVRDLLCHPCNNGLGCARDDPARLRAMAEYLEQHGVESGGERNAEPTGESI